MTATSGENNESAGLLTVVIDRRGRAHSREGVSAPRSEYLVLIEVASTQSVRREFPTQRNRELFRRNREF